MRWGALAICMFCLAGCATTTPPPVVHVICGVTVKEYAATDQAEVADEMAAAPGALWPSWIVDYGRERAALRACARAATP
jgi:hypothetical protein